MRETLLAKCVAAGMPEQPNKFEQVTSQPYDFLFNIFRRRSKGLLSKRRQSEIDWVASLRGKEGDQTTKIDGFARSR
jgi:hypothetical protein